MVNGNNSDNNKTQTYSNSDNLQKTQKYSYNDNSQKTQKYSDDETKIKKTQTYEDENNSQKTQTYEDENLKIIKTEAYDEDTPQRMNKTKAHNLGINDNIELNGIQYTIVEIISEGTGEAVIYKIKDQKDSMFALKLYYHLSPQKEPNPESLHRIKNIKDPDILRLYDYGTGLNKYQDKFCFEVSDFARGGDLLSVNNIKKKYIPKFLKSNVIPEIFKGIKRLHKNRIIHCDLKPENVFYLDTNQTDLIIGDYGSAKTFDKNFGNSFRITNSFNGTPLFIAPELERYIVTNKNDYYSFGMIILRLLYPELATDADKEMETFRLIKSRRFKGQKIIDFNINFKEINTLIEGLTLEDNNKRWGEKEVEKWINGEQVEVLYPTRSDIIPIKLGKVTIRTEKDLINYIEKNVNWSEKLIQNEAGYSLLIRWISSLQDLDKSIIFDRMIRYYQQDGEGYFKEAILRYFNPERPIKIDMKKYNFFSSEHSIMIDVDSMKTQPFFNKDNLNDLVDSFFKQLDDIWKFTNIEKIRFYIFQLEFCLRQLKEVSEQELNIQITAVLEKISAVLNITPKDDFFDYQAVLYTKIDDIILLDLFYAFNEKRVFKDNENKSYNTLKKVGLLFAKNEKLFNDKFIIIEKQKFFNKRDKKELNDRSYIDTLIRIYPNKVMSDIEFIDLNNIKDDKCKITYKFQKSLTEFFNSKGINKEFLKLSPEVNEFDFEKDSDCGWFKFLNHLKSKHNIQDKDLATNNKKEFRSKLLIKAEQNKLDIKITKVKEKFKNREKLLKDIIRSIKYSDNYDYYDNNNLNYLWSVIAIIIALVISWR